MFRALLVEKDEKGYRASVQELEESRLPAGDVTVRVEYSTLNYKDALVITGKGAVAKTFPLVPGIDLAGTVEQSASSEFREGDSVLLNGWGIGEQHWGGLAGKARVKSEWLLPVPRAFTAKRAMAIGTAGYTAMLCVLALERGGVTPERGEVVVTGATGGVGSIAVAVLAKLGYRVVAVTGRAAESEYLKGLGAAEVMDRAELSKPGKPLGKARWAGAVDVVGSHTLANICATTQYNGVVTACGLAGGMDLPATVAPFILRGVTLAGIESVFCAPALRKEAWARLSEAMDVETLDGLTEEIDLDEAIPTAEKLLDGRVRGRIAVKV